MKKKRFLSALLASAMLLSGFSVPALAVDASNPYYFKYEFDGSDEDYSMIKAYRDVKCATENINAETSLPNFDAGSNINDGILTVTRAACATAGRLKVAVPVELAGKEDVWVQVRMKLNSPSNRLNADGTLANNNTLLHLGGDTAYTWGLGFSTNGGYIGYTQRGDKIEGTYSTEYKMYPNIWHTYTMKLDMVEHKMTISLADENGGSYIAENVDINTSHFETIDGLWLPIMAKLDNDLEVDYIRMWDNSLLSGVSASYNGTDLEGQVLPFEDPVVTLTLDTAIDSNTSLSGITINNDATVTPVLSDDGKTITVTLSNLTQDTDYTLSATGLGGNADAEFNFKTEVGIAEVSASYNGADLEGQMLPVDAGAVTLTLGKAISADADLSGITIDEGATATPVLSDDCKNITVTLSNLDYDTYYTLSVTGLEEHNDATFSFMTEMPKVVATIGGNDLAGARGVKNGNEVELSFDKAITEDEFDTAYDGIVLDNGGTATAAFTDANAVTVTLSDLAIKGKYTLTVPQIGANEGGSFTFRAADEPKYIMRAEFDGTDETELLFQNNDFKNYTSIPADDIADGWLSNNDSSWKNKYLTLKLPEAYDATGKKNIVTEMKFKWTDGILHPTFLDIRKDGTSGPLVRFKVDATTHELLCDTRSNGNLPTETGYEIKLNTEYILTVKMDYTQSKYIATITDTDGNIANISGNFLDNNANGYTTIGSVNAMPGLRDPYAKVTYDYIRVWDDDYGKADVTYDMEGTAVKLEESVLVPTTGNTFTVTKVETPSTTDGITLTDKNGSLIEISADNVGNVITVTQIDDFAYNREYKLTIPSAVTGADNDQVIPFRTIYDSTQDFGAVIAEEALGTDEPNVVFFGGSITQNSGYREIVTDKIKEWFPNANVYNAGKGGTGAEYGWVRLERDVLSKNPDMVFIEFAVNDSKNTKAGAWLESVVRNLNKMDKPPVIVLVYTTVLNFDQNSWAVAEHEKIAEAYGIPSINVRNYIKTLYNQNATFAADWDNKVYLGDGTHPSADASALYGNYINNLLTYHTEDYFVTPSSNDDVEMVNADCRDYYYAYENIDTKLTAVDATKEITFKGTDAIIEISRSYDEGGIIKATLDGEEIMTNEDTLRRSGMPAVLMVKMENLEDTEHTVVITVTGVSEITTTDDKGTDDTSDDEEVTSDATVGVHITSLFAPADSLAEPSAVFTKPEFSASAVTVGAELTATATYTADGKKDYAMFIALYDGEGRLTSITRAAAKTSATTTPLETSVSVTPVEGDAKAKAFIWDSFTGMSPLAESAAIGF